MYPRDVASYWDEVMSQTFCKTSVYTCHHHGTFRSQRRCGGKSVCVHVSHRSTPFRYKEEVLPQTLQSTIRAGVSQLTALCRKRIRVSAGGYSQLLVCGKAAHLVQQVLRGEAHTCSSVSSVAWVSHSTETNTHTCDHTAYKKLTCCENELR